MVYQFRLLIKKETIAFHGLFRQINNVQTFSLHSLYDINLLLNSES